MHESAVKQTSGLWFPLSQDCCSVGFAKNMRTTKTELQHVQQQLADTRREHTRILQQVKDNERYTVTEQPRDTFVITQFYT